MRDSGFRRCVDETFPLTGCYMAYVGSYRRFGTTLLSSGVKQNRGHVTFLKGEGLNNDMLDTKRLMCMLNRLYRGESHVMSSSYRLESGEI